MMTFYRRQESMNSHLKFLRRSTGSNKSDDVYEANKANQQEETEYLQQLKEIKSLFPEYR